MQEIHFTTNTVVTVASVGAVCVMRKAGFRFEQKTGKPLCSLIFVETGELDFAFYGTGDTVCVKPGNVLYIPRKFPYHVQYRKDGMRVKILHFDTGPEALPAFLQKTMLLDSSEAASVFALLSQERINNDLYLLSGVYTLLALLRDETEAVPGKYRQLRPALESIRYQYAEEHKIADYAKQCGMSESFFRRVFREYTGYTPVEYRNRIRLAAAEKLISSGECTVSEAAYLAGFQNLSFYYQLRRKYRNGG